MQSNEQLIRRIFWLVTIGFLLMVAYFTLWSYQRNLLQSEADTLHRLQGIANAIAIQIDPVQHRRLVKRYSQKDAIIDSRQDSDYYQLHRLLKRNAEANMLSSPVYTMIPDTNQRGTFQFVATSQDMPYFRHEYINTHPELFEKFSTGGTIAMYHDEFGDWLSAFAPIRSPQGDAIAIVQVDERFEEFKATATSNAISNIAVSLAFSLPLILLLLYYVRRMLRQDADYQRRLNIANNKNIAMNKELQDSYRQLASLDDLRKEMIANVSHDLRTPLANLSGYIETLTMKKNISPVESEKYLNIAARETMRLRKLIDELFELSRLESNQIQANVEPFSIAEMLQDTISKYQIIANAREIRIEHNLSENTPYIVADIKLIDRVLQNLLDNAIKYNYPENGYIKIELSVSQDILHIAIANTGESISPEDQKHIFKRYYKHANSKYNPDSTGLGLAIVQKIIALHQSNIYVESANNWTIFSFTLPIYKA